MKKSKAVFVTVVMTIMLVIIDASLYKLNQAAFISLTAAIAVYGYFRCASDFCRWLSQDSGNDDQTARYLNDRAPATKKAKGTHTANNGVRNHD